MYLFALYKLWVSCCSPSCIFLIIIITFLVLFQVILLYTNIFCKNVVKTTVSKWGTFFKSENRGCKSE